MIVQDNVNLTAANNCNSYI